MIFYTSIDEISIYNWRKIIEKQEYSYVLKSGKASDEKCKEAFGLLYNEYVDTFGLNTAYVDIIELQNEILIYKIDIVANGELWKKAHLQLAENKLKTKLEAKQINSSEVTVHIEKHMGFQIDEHKTSVLKYYNYLKALENGRG